MPARLRLPLLLTLAFTLACACPLSNPLSTVSLPGGAGRPSSGGPVAVATVLPGDPLAVGDPALDPRLDDPTAPGLYLQPTILDDNGWVTYASGDDITALISDGTSIWAGSLGGGLTQWDLSALRAVRHTPQTGFPLTTVTALAVEPTTGVIFALADDALALGDPTGWRAVTLADLRAKPSVTIPASARLTALATVPASTVVWLGLTFAVDADVPRSAGAVLRYDWAADVVQVIPRDSAGLPVPAVNDIALDAEGAVWLATGDATVAGSLSTLSAQGLWEHRTASNTTGLTADYFTAVEIAPNGDFYAASPLGLHLYLAETDQWTTYRTAAGLNLTFDAATPGGAVWLATPVGIEKITPFGLDGVHAYPPPIAGPAAPLLPPVIVPALTPTPLPPALSQAGSKRGLAQPSGQAGLVAPVRAVVVDATGTVWYGGQFGLFTFSPGGTYQRLTLLDDLLSNAITHLTVADDGALWLSYGGPAALQYTRLYRNRVTHYTDPFQAIAAAYPWAGADPPWPVSPEGLIWLALDTTFWVFNGVNWQSITIPTQYGRQVSNYAVGDSGFLAAFTDNGLVLYRPDFGWLAPTAPGSARFAAPVVALRLVGDSLFVATADLTVGNGGVFRYHVPSDSWTVYDTGTGVPAGPVVALWAAADGQVWAASADGTLLRYRPNRDDWEPRVLALPSDSLPVSRVAGFENGSLALAVRDGLVFVPAAGGGPQVLTAGDSGLLAGPVATLAADSRGFLWLASPYGVQRLPLAVSP